MKTDKTKSEVKEPYQNIYEQYYHFNSEWHNWQNYIRGVIAANGSNCEYIKSQLSELEKYMLNSILGSKWYEHNCPNLMGNEPNTTGFLFWWKQRYIGNLNPVGDTTSKVDECNTFFFNYSKWQYLKSLFQEPEPNQIEIPEELQTDEAKAIFGKAIKSGLITKKDTGYKWMGKSKALLAYMCERIYLPKYDIQTSIVSFPETALNNLFGVTRLGKARYQISGNKKTGGKPVGFEIIDKLFDEAAD